MKIKELKIDVPEGYEIDREHSTFKCIRFKPKTLTYEMIANKLFKDKDVYYPSLNGTVEALEYDINYSADPNNCISPNQANKLMAINKLMNVAKYLNGNWQPDWSNSIEKKWIIAVHDDHQCPELLYCENFCSFGIYFREERLAQQAIDILGEDTIRLAFSTDW